MSSERPSDNIGRRVAFYRQMNGMSAADLSNRTFGAISKGVVANIETGRKRDLTVDELIAISWALGVPPAAIALPIESPGNFVTIAENGENSFSVQVAEAARWFVSPGAPTQRDFSSTMEAEASAAGALATSRFSALLRWWAGTLEMARIRRKLRLAEKLGDDTSTFEERLEEAERDDELNRQRMTTFKMGTPGDG